MFKNKGLILGIIATIILIAGGVFLMSKGSPGPATTTGTTVSSSILVPKDSNITGGIENGNYLPASSSAKLTLVEFGDYECPACGVYSGFVKRLITEMPGKINVVFRSYPLPQHANAMISSQAAEAAGLQGKFWQMHDKLYETQGNWSTNSDAKSIFVDYAKELGLDVNKFTTDIELQSIKDKIQNDKKDGDTVNLTETPTFYLNGVKITLTGNYEDLKKLVSGQL